MTTRTIVAVTAGLSQPSSTRLLADRLVAATVAAMDASGDPVTVRTIELRDLAHQITDNLLTGFPAPELADAIDALTRADGIIAVTPIFTASYSGLFKSFFDIVDSSAITGTPVLLGATAGTARHSLALEHEMRPLFAYLRALITPTAVFAASEDWGSGDGTTTGLHQRITRAAGEFSGLVRGSGVARVTTDPFANLIPFAQQLAGK
ncbi:FMN reductase [Sanguibacter antarcticus]|uniref:FMN reductase n=1 Tax=Sanguibacter antarcticus TaxID=372484 RepID=A0A2A9E3M5_9MICO|nr:FMN reductase [Sanguibacter antarcticus]PFG33171.1 FMN reductase [Sanguibacter antarcticus]